MLQRALAGHGSHERKLERHGGAWRGRGVAAQFGFGSMDMQWCVCRCGEGNGEDTSAGLVANTIFLQLAFSTLNERLHWHLFQKAQVAVSKNAHNF